VGEILRKYSCHLAQVQKKEKKDQLVFAKACLKEALNSCQSKETVKDYKHTLCTETNTMVFTLKDEV
jgi:hypothetical protein